MPIVPLFSTCKLFGLPGVNEARIAPANNLPPDLLSFLLGNSKIVFSLI
jgi:hypothetical protein